MSFDRAYWQHACRYAAQPFWLYEVGHLLNAVRTDARGGSVLDVGCNHGEMLEVFSAIVRPLRLAGVDVNRTAIENGWHFNGDLELLHTVEGKRLPFDDGVFDAVVSLNTLGHALAPSWLLSEMRRVLSPAGKMAVVIPNRLHYRYRHLGRRPPRDPTERHEWSPGEARTLFDTRGLAVTRIETFGRSVAHIPALRSRILVEARRT